MALLILSVIAALYGSSNILAKQPGCGIRERKITRIVGGNNAIPGSWPWQVSMDSLHNKVNPGHACGGTLITDEWVITAAHCFLSSKNKDDYWLVLGQHDLKTPSDREKKFYISELIIHPKFDKKTYDYDIALLRLSGKALFTDYIRPACLPSKKIIFRTGKMCYITGWGLQQAYGVGPAILQQAQVPLVKRENCQAAYATVGDKVTPRMLCAGYKKGGIDACVGDSGGPLVCRDEDAEEKEGWYLWGIVSWGEGCAKKGFYGVFTSITELQRWIDNIVFNEKE